jgi:hypothetical protein
MGPTELNILSGIRKPPSKVLASGLPTLKQSKNRQAQALFREYRCVLLTCIMESHAHADFKAAEAQKVGRHTLMASTLVATFFL